MAEMTPRGRLLAAIRGEKADRTPFAVFEGRGAGLVPYGEFERWLRNKGMAVARGYPVMTLEYPNVSFERKSCREGTTHVIRDTIRTPVGEVWRCMLVGEDDGDTCEPWIRDYFIKAPEDYRVMEFVWRDLRLSRNYAGYASALRAMGEDGILITGPTGFGRSPLQYMLLDLMGLERFSVDLSERREEFESLHETILKKHREIFRLVAEGPGEVVHFGENVTAEVMGPERFRRYLLPYYNEFAGLLHENGKCLSIHMDGKLAALKGAISETGIDMIDGFTPPPVGDLSLAEARSLWKNKTIWLNFTSSMHLASPEEIRAHTVEILRQVSPGYRFIFGVTEDIPENVRMRNLTIISNTLQEVGKLPLDLD